MALPGEALAVWGEPWGTLVWGSTALGVPTIGWLGLGVLVLSLAATAAWALRKRRPGLGLPILLVLLAIPLVVVAGSVTVPNTFENGEVADADEVNANFGAVKTAVDDNDARATTAQSTADAAQNTANTAQSAATTANTNATAASSAASAAQGTAGANTTAISNQSAEISALQAQVAVFETYLASLCGNGHLEPGIEACDDGNTTDDGNGCSASCQAYNVCGNGIIESLFETCDDGNATDDGNGCSASCQANNVCGNGIIEPVIETCDDGNIFDNGNGCSASCQENDVCGNGITESLFEACDDGNATDDGNGCSASCQANNVCGNGIIEPAIETCDDDGVTGADGCSALCAIEPGWVCTGEPSTCVLGFEACADGVTVADDLTGLLWERKTGTFGPIVVCETAPGGCPDPHDVNNLYEWSNTGSAADGNAYTDFLALLNTAPGFAGYTDWRLPIISELQSILVGPGVTTVATASPADPASGTNPRGQSTTCNAAPCIDPVFAAIGGPTAPSLYWSASSVATSPGRAWAAGFIYGVVHNGNKPGDIFVRAVRTGSCTD